MWARGVRAGGRPTSLLVSGQPRSYSTDQAPRVTAPTPACVGVPGGSTLSENHTRLVLARPVLVYLPPRPFVWPLCYLPAGGGGATDLIPRGGLQTRSDYLSCTQVPSSQASFLPCSWLPRANSTVVGCVHGVTEKCYVRAPLP